MRGGRALSTGRDRMPVVRIRQTRVAARARSIATG